MILWVILGVSLFVALMVTGVSEEKPPCEHKNATTRKWLDRNDTPMAATNCPDCGFSDTGHVYADPKTWISDSK